MVGFRELRRLLNHLQKYLSEYNFLIGSSVLRLLVGIIMSYYFLGRWGQWRYLWGPDSVYLLWLFERDLPRSLSFSIYAVESDLVFDILYILGALTSVCYTIGWRTRLIGPLFYLFTWSIFKRNVYILSGGENLLYVVLPFMLVMNTSAYISADSNWRSVRSQVPDNANSLLSLMHNFSVLYIIIQLCILYWVTAVQKIGGTAWFHGTAVYYITRVPAFSIPEVSGLIYLNEYMVTLLTYFTILFEISYPYMLLIRYGRTVAVVSAIIFHVGIAYLMGLVIFSSIMIAFQSILIKDSEYRRLYGVLNDVAKIRRKMDERHE